MCVKIYRFVHDEYEKYTADVFGDDVLNVFIFFYYVFRLSKKQRNEQCV